MFSATQLLERDFTPNGRERRRMRTRNQLFHSPYWERASAATAAVRDVFRSSLFKGVLAARQVAIPIVVVQVVMVSLVLSFFFVAPVQTAFQQVVAFKNQMGFPFAFVSMGLISVFAECIRRMGARETDDSFVGNAAYGFVVFGFLGVATDAFYMLQGAMWSWLPPGAQIPAKVLTDQFVYTVFFANPYQTLLYVFKDCGFRMTAFANRLQPFRHFYAREMLAVLVTNWAFWIPTTAILYCLPSDLQFVICQLAIVIWVLLLTTLTKTTK